MTDSCSCPPGDCHGGHTINIGPARLTDEQLRQLRDDPLADYHHAGITAMAAELLALRAQVAELEAERTRIILSRQDRLRARTARVAELEAVNHD